MLEVLEMLDMVEVPEMLEAGAPKIGALESREKPKALRIVGKGD